MYKILILLLISIRSYAFQNYYPKQFRENIKNGHLNPEQMKKDLQKIMYLSHIVSKNEDDLLVKNCEGKKNCFTHRVFSYQDARRILFGTLFLEKDELGIFLKDNYCNIIYRESSFKEAPIGKGKIPNHHFINCEHIWPQSKFNKTFSKDMQKSDLHHLLPVSSYANSTRGNYPFAEVEEVLNEHLCSPSSFGYDVESNQSSYEPPSHIKGDIARAMFYFSIKYNSPIDQYQEAVLRKWNQIDPVSSHEMIRNNLIYKIQYTRNPFIDIPALVDIIKDF
ncbi:MAG: endonuclease [Halobacteriovoraceae bacterium]|nr:endonuclease [Halobacteriovoraceae bacterium]